jgi:transcriptional regulator with XRE-family HTH domain
MGLSIKVNKLRKPATRSDSDFQFEVMRKFRRAVEAGGLTQATAAAQLGVSRQAFNRYWKGAATPSAPVLANACHLWGLKFRYRGVDFGTTAFFHSDKARQPNAAQLELFEPPLAIDGGGLLLKFGAKGAGRPELTIEIRRAS